MFLRTTFFSWLVVFYNKLAPASALRRLTSLLLFYCVKYPLIALESPNNYFPLLVNESIS